MTTLQLYRLCTLVLLSTFCISQNSFATDGNFVKFYCPGDQTIHCGDDVYNLDKYGHATLETYSGVVPVYASEVSHHLDACGSGYIVRKFTTHDPYGGYHSCIQTIWVEPAVGYHFIHWPSDTIIAGCNVDYRPEVLGDNGNPVTRSRGCNQLGVSYNDQVFDFGPGCKKVVRTWKVIDWCAYKPNTGSPLGQYSHTQVIKISNIEKPSVVFPEDITVTAQNCNETYIHFPDVGVDYTSCGGEVEVTHNSSYADARNGGSASGIYPVGESYVRYRVTYGCGLEISKTIRVTVNDDVAPVAYCINYLTVSLMPVFTEGIYQPTDGMAEIWASDFDKGSYSKCDHGGLEFSFSEDVEDNVRYFTCDEIGDNEFQMWVTDEKGNQGYCRVHISVQNNAADIPNCGTGMEESLTDYNVNGTVTRYYDNSPVENVEVGLTGMGMGTLEVEVFDTTFVDDNETVIIIDGQEGADENMIITSRIDTIVTDSYDMVMTKDEGQYAFDGLSMNAHYRVAAQDRTYPDRDNITEGDYRILKAFVASSIREADPYFLIAADLDNSGTVDQLDVDILRQFLDGDIDAFPIEESWVYINAAYSFDEESESWTAYQSLDMKDMALETEEYQVDFVAIPKGDFLPLESLIIDGRSKETSSLENVFPNPFVNKIHFDIVLENNDRIDIYISDVQGKVIQTLTRELTSGNHNLSIDTRSLLSGVYLYEVVLGNQSMSGKLIK